MNFEVGQKVEWQFRCNSFTYKGKPYTAPLSPSGKWVPAVIKRIDVDHDGYRWVVIELYNGLQRRCSYSEQRIWLRHVK